MRSEDMCVCCGCYVPEGTMVCPACMMEAGKEISRNEIKYLLNRYLKECHKGIDNAVFGSVIEDAFAISGREIRRMVSELRKEGFPICSDYRKGYYYANSEEEINRTVLGLNEHASGVANTVKNLKSAVVDPEKGSLTIRLIVRLEDTDDGCKLSVKCE